MVSSNGLHPWLHPCVLSTIDSVTSFVCCRTFIKHVLLLFNEFGCPDGIWSPLMVFTVHIGIASVPTSSYPFIKSLIDLISEAHGQLVELGISPAVVPVRSPMTVSDIFCYSVVYNAGINMKTRLKVKKEWIMRCISSPYH